MAAPPDAILKNIVDNAKDQGGAKVIPDNQWPVFAQHMGFPKNFTAFTPLTGPYSGISFVPAKQAVKPGLAAGADVPAQALSGGAFQSISDAINSTTDFLKFIAWLFHPRNILRAVEFLVGLILMGFGLQAAMQARGEGVEGFTTSEGVLTRSGLGRVATELGRATRGSGTAGHPKPRKPQRPRSAPHRTRQRALKNRYLREETRYRNRAN